MRTKISLRQIFQIFLGLLGVVHGETFVVTTADDSGEGSLREAISLANMTAESDEVVFSSGENETIDFGDGTSRVITVSSTLIITNPLSIFGPGKDLLAIDGGGDGDFLVENSESRIFSLSGSTAEEPHRLSGLTVSNGATLLGGANIRAIGSLELLACRVSGGRAVASAPGASGNNSSNADGGGLFHSGGDLLVDGCEISGNGTFGNFSQGGGLYSENGMATIRNSRIFLNTTNGVVSEGGGIGLRSPTVMENCEVSQNETLASSSGGGGIYTDDDFVARNSTLSANVVGAETGVGGYSVGGAFASVGGDAFFESCTIVDNEAPPGRGQGGGISSLSRGDISFFSTILIGNDATDLDRIQSAGFIDLGFNLFGIGDGFDLIPVRQTTSIYGVTTREGLLADLDFYGGSTRTHRLLASQQTQEVSAINNGPTRSEFEEVTEQVLLFDQRGGNFPRLVEGQMDIGAYEFQTSVDGDGDGLPDAVEQIVEGLDPEVPDGDGDLDRDGITNFAEYILLGISAISDPSLRSVLSFEVESAQGEVQVGFQASLDREYRLWVSSDLSDFSEVMGGEYSTFPEDGFQKLSISVVEPSMFFQLEGRIPQNLVDGL